MIPARRHGITIPEELKMHMSPEEAMQIFMQIETAKPTDEALTLLHRVTESSNDISSF